MQLRDAMLPPDFCMCLTPFRLVFDCWAHMQFLERDSGRRKHNVEKNRNRQHLDHRSRILGGREHAGVEHHAGEGR